jgi:hypothetical protein
MTDVRNSGYLAEAQTVAWSSNGFDALTDNEWTDASDVIDNSTTGYMFADFEFNLGSFAWPNAADNAIELYIIPSVDGTNYPEYNGGGGTGDEQENNQLFVGSVTGPSNETTTARLAIRGIELPAGKFKVGIRNRAGQTLNATNTCKWRPWGYKSA